jgi:catechol 2,3-dioxygenase-like lactoylglutathione lyase family enzyme
VGTAADNHVAVRVSDMDCAIVFYVDALDGRLQTTPSIREDAFIEEVFGPGTRVKVCHIGFERGALELWQFLEPYSPVPESDQRGDALMHWSFTVDDVEESLRRVEEAGGRRRFDVKRLSRNGPKFVYCTDPDGHVFELLEADHDEVVRVIIQHDPESAPA